MRRDVAGIIGEMQDTLEPPERFACLFAAFLKPFKSLGREFLRAASDHLHGRNPMPAIDLDTEIDRLRLRLAPLAKFVTVLAETFDAPMLTVGEDYRGYRYKTATVVHFCLLK